MVKTIYILIYNWVINTDNDAVMEKFTNQRLPETQYRGHHDELAISAHARQGNGEEVWRTMSKKIRSKILKMTKIKFISNAERMLS